MKGLHRNVCNKEDGSYGKGGGIGLLRISEKFWTDSTGEKQLVNGWKGSVSIHRKFKGVLLGESNRSYVKYRGPVLTLSLLRLSERGVSGGRFGDTRGRRKQPSGLRLLDSAPRETREPPTVSTVPAIYLPRTQELTDTPCPKRGVWYGLKII